jgi:dihydropteroate synthase
MTEAHTDTMVWQVGGSRGLALDAPRLMGIVNATPDSFSDGGEHGSARALADHALRLVADGASIIDVGGESTRPGATRVEAAEQIDRTVPVIEAVRAESDVLVSIDTTRAAVAAAAIDAGAQIVNDVSAGVEDDSMLGLVAARGCGLVLMHRLRPPDTDQYSDRYDAPPEYDDVVGTVAAHLEARADAARAAGVRREAIVIDPGLGFGKTVEQNLELVRRTGELQALGYPVLSAASRKSFVGAVTGCPEPRERVAGSTAISVHHALAGVRLFRVHDVAAHRDVLAVTEALVAASKVPQPGPGPRGRVV